MSKSTTSETKGILATQLGTNPNPNSKSNSEIFEKIPVENSPFVIIGTKEKGYMLMLGIQGLLEKRLPTVDDVINWMNTHTWDLAFRMAIAISEHSKKETEIITK